MISAKKSLLEKKIKLISKNIENVLIELLHETVDAKKARPKTRKSKKVILKKTSASSSLKAKGRPKGGLMEVLIEYASKQVTDVQMEPSKEECAEGMEQSRQRKQQCRKEGCNNAVVKGGVCIKHTGAEMKRKL